MQSGELIMIRHGATDSPGCLNGRTDVGLAEVPAPVSLVPGRLWVSPARRARETAAGLFPGRAGVEDARFWEQDFGDWDGMPFDQLPNVGELKLPELAALKGPGGEDFFEVVERVRPAFEARVAEARGARSPVVVVAHAGVVRAALAVVLGQVPGALAFEVGHLSATRFRCHAGGVGVMSVNEVLA